MEASSGLSGKKIYFTDGTLPNYKEKGIPEDSLGISCAVNDAANSMLPPMLRSNRPDSLLHLMKVCKRFWGYQQTLRMSIVENSELALALALVLVIMCLV